MALIRALVASLALVFAVLPDSVHAQTLFSSGTGVHVFYRTGWTAPYIHYNTGSGWTTSPGVAMTASNDSTNFPSAIGWFRYDLPSTVTALEFVFNNGAGTWDNNNNANYKVTSGTWQITSTVSTPTSATVKTKADDGTGLHVFFQTGWTKPYIHYTTGSGWTTSPGVTMSASTDSTYPASIGWFEYDFASPTSSLEFVFNNGAGTWDNNNSSNYKATSAGTWIVMSTITANTTIVTSPATTTATPTSTTQTPASTTPAPTPSGSCYNYNGLDSCSSDSQTDMPSTDDERKWQTPPRDADDWTSEYQDYRCVTLLLAPYFRRYPLTVCFLPDP
jgi:alpha-amylase